MNASTEPVLRQLIAGVAPNVAHDLGVDDDLVRELGLDSLAGLRVLAAVEKRFDVRFPDERLGEFRTLRQLLDFVSAKEDAR